MPPPVGTFAASTQQTASSSQVLYQDLELPSSGNIRCSLIYYYITFAPDFITPPTLSLNVDNQQARIYILDPDSDPFNVTDAVLENLFHTQPGDPIEVGYTPLNFDLTEYAGTTVRLRAAEADNEGAFRFSIDDVTCEVVKGIPTLGQWGMIAMAGVLAIASVLFIRKRRFHTS